MSNETDVHERGFISEQLESLPSLRRNYCWAAIGFALYAFSQWLVIAIFARTLPAAELGWYVLALAICTPVFEFVGLNLPIALANDACGRYVFGEYLALYTVGIVGASLLITGGAAATVSNSVLYVVAATVVAKAVERMSLLCYGMFQKVERFALIAKSQLLRAVGAIGAVLAAVWMWHSAAAAAMAMAAAWLAVLCLHDFVEVRKIVGKGDFFSRVRLRRLLGLGSRCFGLGVTLAASSLNANLPRYFVQGILGPETLGIFGALSASAAAIRSFFTPVLNTVVPRLAKYYPLGGRTAYLRLLAKALIVALAAGTVVTACAWLGGRWFLTIAFSPQFAAYADVFLILVVAVSLRLLGATFAGCLFSMWNFATSGINAALAFLVLAGGLAVLTPTFGLHGAAWAVCLGAAAELVLMSLAVLQQLSQWKGSDSGRPTEKRHTGRHTFVKTELGCGEQSCPTRYAA